MSTRCPSCRPHSSHGAEGVGAAFRGGGAQHVREHAGGLRGHGTLFRLRRFVEDAGRRLRRSCAPYAVPATPAVGEGAVCGAEGGRGRRLPSSNQARGRGRRPSPPARSQSVPIARAARPRRPSPQGRPSPRSASGRAPRAASLRRSSCRRRCRAGSRPQRRAAYRPRSRWADSRSPPRRQHRAETGLMALPGCRRICVARLSPRRTS